MADKSLRNDPDGSLDENASTIWNKDVENALDQDTQDSYPEFRDTEIVRGVGASEGKTSQSTIDFASKGYSALVVALALGGALGPLAGGSLTRKQVPRFESYPYFAPCLLVSLIGLLITGIVSLVLNESHPRWAKHTELDRAMEKIVDAGVGGEDIRCLRRGRPGYETAIQHPETPPLALEPSQASIAAQKTMGTVESQESLFVGTACSQPIEARSGAQPQATLPTCTCETIPSLASRPSNGLGSTKLSPATELYLTLIIYTLLVLTSILGSEFVMLYTQSPVLRGGLGFSAKVLGEVLTMRGIIKLVFNLFGYPWMVVRLGLLRCLRLGIVVIGTISVIGLGCLVPWSVYKDIHLFPRAASRAGLDSGVENGEGSVAGVGVFGKSANRLEKVDNKRGAKSLEDVASEPSQQSTVLGGNGVLWSVAQASANVMRLAGPVLAGYILKRLHAKLEGTLTGN
ncbi:hypothetical protein BGX28_003724 [Mortierella sp. GBA30]|nr:hypothetical protein BGX28_003724 [Mortierella sp. GBA30]